MTLQINSYLGEANSGALMAVLGLHVFHTVFYQPLAAVDWVHHILMIGFVLPTAYILQPGRLLGHGIFYASGLPGGIDYLMLALVKMGYMESLTEKRYNAIIQTWIRAPGCLAHSFISYTTYMFVLQAAKEGRVREVLPVHRSYIHEENTTLLSICSYFTIILFFWNGLYFQSRVVENTAVKEYERRNKIKGKDKEE